MEIDIKRHIKSFTVLYQFCVGWELLLGFCFILIMNNPAFSQFSARKHEEISPTIKAIRGTSNA